MEIQKRLILNKTPKDMPYGSVPCAKNMMIDDTGSFYTNDIGFKESFKCGANEVIVGVIPCNEELVIFTCTQVSTPSNPRISRVYRKPDDVVIDDSNREQYIVRCNWSWSGGKICGSYTYNYKGELIIAVGEYDSPDVDYIPLKTWNMNTASIKQTYATEEIIPSYDSAYDITTNGSLLCGVYTFFIRFKIDEYNFTKWFQITGDINITQEAQSKRYNHYYLTQGDHQTVLAKGDFTVNKNEISNKCIVIMLDFLDYYLNDLTINDFQLGYIIKRNSDIAGRIQGEYSISFVEDNNKLISVIDNTFIEEIGVDEMLEAPNQFFNVKNIVNYNNRLYIANYKEYELEDLSLFARDNTFISIQGGVNSTHRVSGISSTNSITFTLDFIQSGNTVKRKENVIPFPEYSLDSDGYLSDTDAVSFIRTLANHLTLYPKYGFEADFDPNHTPRLYWFIQRNDNIYDADSAICLDKDTEYGTPIEHWRWNFDVPDYRIKIIGTTKDDLDIIIEANNAEWSLLGKNRERSCILGYDDVMELAYFGNSGKGYTKTDIQFGSANTPKQMNDDIKTVVVKVGDEEDTPSEPGGIIESSGVNTRTLYPNQKYNFFIHYIRKDGSYTQGFQIFLDYKSFELTNDNTVLIPKISANKPNSDVYIGYFITYEDIESNVDCIYIASKVDGTGGSSPKIYFTNAEYLYDLNTIRGSKVIINGTTYDVFGLNYIENKLTHNHVEGILEEGSEVDISSTNIAYFLKTIKNIYSNKTKILYRLCKNIYTFETEVTDQDYLPAFYNKQNLLFYTIDTNNAEAKEVILDPASSYVVAVNGVDDPRTTYNVDMKSPAMYSQYPTEAMNINKDFQQASVVLNRKVQGETEPSFRTNTIISPDNLPNFLDLKACYMAKPSKSYINYNNDKIFVFDKTIYRSDVISDESLVNGFRHFDVKNYKNILENKGKIVNIIGIGLYFIVHTEFSIFVFDRTPKLTAKSQLDIPDVFDTDYQDIMPSNEGFGGLADKEEAILTKNGYVWYDRRNKIIFNYENGKATILSADINNFLKYLNISYVRFAEDIECNRLIICIYTIYENTGESTITLSYNFNTKTFISIHDYKFTNNYRTCNKSYVFDNDSCANKLFEFDKNSIVDYKDLYTPQTDYFPHYAGENELAKSYIDVIFNKDYFIPKVVNNIRYVLSEILEKIYSYKITEERLERHYAGNELKIYTDETDSGELDISIQEPINKLDDYKHPFYDKGAWNLNYFRNRINETGDSDSKSLIYGKYAVVRFIFNNDIKVKFESVDIQTNPY